MHALDILYAREPPFVLPSLPMASQLLLNCDGNILDYPGTEELLVLTFVKSCNELLASDDPDFLMLHWRTWYPFSPSSDKASEDLFRKYDHLPLGTLHSCARQCTGIHTTPMTFFGTYNASEAGPPIWVKHVLLSLCTLNRGFGCDSGTKDVSLRQCVVTR